MRRVQADDADAFDELHARYYVRALGYARVLCSSVERAEDAVQDAFVCLWSSRARYQPRGELRTWLFALVRNRCIDVYRHNRRGDGLRASEARIDALAAAGCVEDDVIQRDEDARMRTALRRLPNMQREAVELSYFGQFTHAEIAGMVNAPLGTVKGRIRLGLEKARAGVDHPAATMP